VQSDRLVEQQPIDIKGTLRTDVHGFMTCISYVKHFLSLESNLIRTVKFRPSSHLGCCRYFFRIRQPSSNAKTNVHISGLVKSTFFNKK
jgi:hypothetical protein